MPQDALILEFDGDEVDDYGEPLLGWYWQMVKSKGNLRGGLMGPYGTSAEAEAACRRAFNRGE